MNSKLHICSVNILLVIASSTFAAGPLLLHYDFDEGSGTVVNDRSASAFHGTLTGASWTTSGKIGGALSFDRDGDYVAVGNVLDLGGELTAFSVSAWTKMPLVPLDANNALWIIGNEDISPPYTGWTLMQWNRHMVAQIRTSDGAQIESEGTTFVSDDEWHHVVGIFVSDGIKFYTEVYVDGNLEDTSEVAAPVGTAVTSSHVWVGARYPNSSMDCLGLIDDLRVYKGILTLPEIQALYQISFTPDPRLYYDFNTDEGSLVSDQSTNGNNGTAINATHVAEGALGGALQFNGSTSVVFVPGTSTLDIRGDLSVSAWYYVDDYSNSDMPLIYWHDGASEGVQVVVNFLDTGCMANIHDRTGLDHFLAAANPDPGRWNHVAIVYNSITGNGKLYLNGKIVDNQHLGTFDPQTSYSVYLGMKPGNPAVYFGGMIDELKIFASALNEGQVLALYEEIHGATAPAIQFNHASLGPTLSWLSVPGASYMMQERNDLIGGVWENTEPSSTYQGLGDYIHVVPPVLQDSTKAYRIIRQ